MVDYDDRQKAPNYSANESFNKRLSRREVSPRASGKGLSGSPEMSFTSTSPSHYSRRAGEESIRAMVDGEEEEERNLRAVPFKIVMLGNVDVGKTCIVQRYIHNHFQT